MTAQEAIVGGEQVPPQPPSSSSPQTPPPPTRRIRQSCVLWFKNIFFNRRWSKIPREANYINSPFITAIGIALFFLMVIADM
jgi:hypothetical protein